MVETRARTPASGAEAGGSAVHAMAVDPASPEGQGLGDGTASDNGHKSDSSMGSSHGTESRSTRSRQPASAQRPKRSSKQEGGALGPSGQFQQGRSTREEGEEERHERQADKGRRNGDKKGARSKGSGGVSDGSGKGSDDDEEEEEGKEEEEEEEGEEEEHEGRWPKRSANAMRRKSSIDTLQQLPPSGRSNGKRRYQEESTDDDDEDEEEDEEEEEDSRRSTRKSGGRATRADRRGRDSRARRGEEDDEEEEDDEDEDDRGRRSTRYNEGGSKGAASGKDKEAEATTGGRYPRRTGVALGSSSSQPQQVQGNGNGIGSKVSGSARDQRAGYNRTRGGRTVDEISGASSGEGSESSHEEEERDEMRQLLIESTEGQRVTRSRVTQLKSGGAPSGSSNRNGNNRSHGGGSRSGGGRRDQRGGGAEQNGRAYPLRERKTVLPYSVEQQMQECQQLRGLGGPHLRDRTGGGTPGRRHGRDDRYNPHRASSHHRSRRNGRRKRHYDSSSMSDSSSGSSDSDTGFQRYQRNKFKDDMDSIQPINQTAGNITDRYDKRDVRRADAIPVGVDASLDWSSVGGLQGHVRALKEMVMFPLLYPEYFDRFDVTPPRGVLFYGPPGTGKTLLARALAATCSKGGRPVAFFMRKGADCLSKWVGEAERQLRLLFEQARRHQPSIIFFDEIDGLAPVRSAKQDQIHASIVSTLLALMDGLDNRGQVIVIGATNRPDAVDPALRRPGRFDRELGFTLPDRNARRQILDVHVSKWNPPLSVAFKNELAEQTVGYCGADLKALCTEAAMRALRRRFPQIYHSHRKLAIKQADVMVLRSDFADAMKAIAPAAHRAASTYAAALPPFLSPLLQDSLERAIKAVNHQGMLPLPSSTANGEEEDDEMVLEDEEEVRAVYGIINRNNCDACGGGGSLVCCDFCAAAYHERCIPDNTPVPDLETDDPWRCPTCFRKAAQGESGDANTDASCEGRSLAPLLHRPLDPALGSATGATGSSASTVWNTYSLVHRPRLLLRGGCGMGQGALGAALLHRLESLPLYGLDLPTLLSDPSAPSPEHALVAKTREAQRNAPSVVYVPNLERWGASAYASLREALVTAITSMPPSCPVLLLATTQDADPFSTGELRLSVDDDEEEGCPKELLRLFQAHNDAEARGDTLVPLLPPTPQQCAEFFSDVLSELSRLHNDCREEARRRKEARIRKKQRMREVLAAAPDRAEVKIIDPLEVAREKARLEHYKRELRVCFRSVLRELFKDRRYQYFYQPVDPEEVPDYYTVVPHPVDLETMRAKVDERAYETREQFRQDIIQIRINAELYNPRDKDDHRGKAIVSAACNMLDHVDSMFHNFKRSIGYDLFKRLDKAYASAQRQEDDKTGGPNANRSNANGSSGAMGGGGGGLASPNGVGRRSKRLQPTSAGEDLLLVELGNSERSLRIQGNSDEDTARPAKKQKTAHGEDGEDGGEEKQGEEGGDKEHSPTSSSSDSAAGLQSPSAAAPGGMAEQQAEQASAEAMDVEDPQLTTTSGDKQQEDANGPVGSPMQLADLGASPVPTITTTAPPAIAPPSVNAEALSTAGGEADGPTEGGPQPVTAGDAIMQAAEGSGAEKQDEAQSASKEAEEESDDEEDDKEFPMDPVDTARVEELSAALTMRTGEGGAAGQWSVEQLLSLRAALWRRIHDHKAQWRAMEAARRKQRRDARVAAKAAAKARLANGEGEEEEEPQAEMGGEEVVIEGPSSFATQELMDAMLQLVVAHGGN